MTSALAAANVTVTTDGDELLLAEGGRDGGQKTLGDGDGGAGGQNARETDVDV